METHTDTDTLTRQGEIFIYHGKVFKLYVRLCKVIGNFNFIGKWCTVLKQKEIY